MAKRRGFFAEMQHHAAVVERDRQRANATALREAQRREREAERAHAAAERARIAATKADARAAADAERQAKRLHIEAQEAQAEALNSQLAAALEDIDSVLSWTLDHDDHVELEDLRQEPVHPPFVSEYINALPVPAPLEAPPEPTLKEPPAPTGVSAIFGKKKHAIELEEARLAFAAEHAAWREAAAAVPMRQLRQMNDYQAAEHDRKQRLAADQAQYDAQSRERQKEADVSNARLDALKIALEAGEEDAVEEYLSIVFGNSVYPADIDIEIEHTYRAKDRELHITLSLPKPSSIPAVRSYKYVKAKDEIASTYQSAKEQKERYANLLHGTVLRTLHEVWESDRRQHVQTISLIAGVEHIDPATGRPTSSPLLAIAAERTTFEEIDLANVTPAETLKHLKAVVSKNPHTLVPIEIQGGVRG